MNKRIFLILLISLFLVSFVSSVSLSEVSVCCEKTKLDSVGNGIASCINTKKENCDPSESIAPTNCDQTSFCKLGTCYDSLEGICMDNVPQTTCESSGGTWDERDSSEIPQCQLGCCLIAEQAAFVPLVRCKKLSTFFGVSINYRTDINSEFSCILEAQNQDKGACVYEEDFEKLCKFTTRKDCDGIVQVEVVNKTVSTGKKFYKDYLCSAEELGTSCAKQVSTECYNGKVYWVDSCNNRENVYLDGSAAAKEISWNNGMVKDADKICKPSNGENPNCGNCDYFQGARCGKVEGVFSNKPKTGDLLCKRTECKDWEGNERLNGESWCVHPAKLSDKSDAVGSRYFKETCIDGEVIIEPCADFRNEICIEGSTKIPEGEYSSAACRVNRWQECLLQTEKKDCENQDKRDCKWIESVEGLAITEGQSSTTNFGSTTTGGNFAGRVIAPITGNALFGGDSKGEENQGTFTNRAEGVCVPAFAPGFNFWEESDSEGICSQASAKCIVEYSKGLLDSSWKVKKGKECLSEQWALKANTVCSAIGDCGGSVNYKGIYSDEGYNWVGTKKLSNNPKDVERQEFSPTARNTIKKSMTGFAVSPAYIINKDLKLNAEAIVYVKTE